MQGVKGGTLPLFPPSNGPEYPPEDTPRSHRRDPETSRQAAKRLKRSGNLKTQRQAVLEALRHCNGGTHAEIGEFMGVHWLAPARRLPELERDGLVRKGAARICRVKGSRCCTWWTVHE